jgi:DNA-nicking Smr family endonuclease
VTKPIRTLSDLGALRQQLKERAREEERLRQEAALRDEKARREASVFRDAIGEVAPLKAKRRREPHKVEVAPYPAQTRLDERAVLHESISDEFSPEALLETDDTLSWRREGIGMDIVRKLRRGEWVIQDQIDLHGMRTDEARAALVDFLRESTRRERRCVRVVHGKGLGSANKEPVLKGKVRVWLTQREEVLAYAQARPPDGGSGAIVVLLKGR